MAVGEDVYCTLVLSDSYLPGAAVLAHSLRDLGSTKKLACLIDQSNLRHTTVTELQALYNYVIPIERIGNPKPANLYLLGRPELIYSFTKIQLWRMIQFRKIVYIDADVVALRAPEELFDTQEDFAAAPDVGWPDCFNSGVMVVSPNMGDYWALKTLAEAGDSFDGADQGLLNQYFEHRPWKRLSFIYNVTPSANYQYEPAYRYYKHDIRMIHFIGSGKPWQEGRTAKGTTGTYQELLSRWWAVYDRHFKVSTSDYVSTGQREPISYVVQREVRGERESVDHGYYATGYPVDSTNPAPPSGAPAITTEKPFTEPGEHAENISQGLVEPQPTSEARKFSAPYLEWDATRAEPPAHAKPEAPNFPTTQYEFSSDPEPFHPPASYPQPPRDMYYQVPGGKAIGTKDEKLAPIFPWEERQDSKPTRKFVEDEQPPVPPQPEPEPELDFVGADEFSVQSDSKDEPMTPMTAHRDEAPWHTHGPTSKNAWDDVAGIESYVRALTASQRKRGQVQVLQHDAAAQPQQTHILSPTNEPSADELIEKVKERRESLILTDFPTAIERPSLPVTPAPIRRNTFWGGQRDSEGELPPAEGVPDQSDWDPSESLEQLRRNSLLGPGDLKLPSTRVIPDRRMPKTSATIPEEALSQPHVAISSGGGLVSESSADATESKLAKGPPTFSEPVFSGKSGKSEPESALSPTEQAAAS